MSDLTITKDQLRAALERWELSNRAGECLNTEEVAALPVDEVVDSSVEHLWALLHTERANQSLIAKLGVAGA